MRLGNAGTSAGFAPQILRSDISGAPVRMCRRLHTARRGSHRPPTSTSGTTRTACCQTAPPFAARIKGSITGLEPVPPGPRRLRPELALSAQKTVWISSLILSHLTEWMERSWMTTGNAQLYCKPSQHKCLCLITDILFSDTDHEDGDSESNFKCSQRHCNLFVSLFVVVVVVVL